VQGDVAPGEIIVISVSSMGSPTTANLQLDSTGAVSTKLSNTTVTFDELSAPIIQVIAGAITAIAPYEIAGRLGVNLVVQVNGLSSPAINAAVVDTAPGIFVNQVVGTASLNIFNSDLSVNAAANPAAKSSVITFFVTGEGVLNPVPATGSVAKPTAGAFAKPVKTVSLTIGGVAATVQYAGQAPGLISGILEIQAQVPPAAASGAQPLVLTIGAASTILQAVTVVVAA
jgi:uncharacterized protein (TIGR03437 family)